MFTNPKSHISTYAVVLAMSVLLASCTHQRVEKEDVAIAPPPPEPEPQPEAEPDLEAVWHVRAGLNVGALSCRGTYEGLAAAYNQLLQQQKDILAQSYQHEESLYPTAELDWHLTGIYNRFANQRQPQHFCQIAQNVVDRAMAVDGKTFSTSAAVWLTELEQALL